MDTNTVQVIEEFGKKLDGYIISGWVELSFLLLSLIVSICLVRLGYKYIKKDSTDSEDIKSATLLIIGSILLFLVALFMFINVGDILSKILNPEYYAVQELVGMVRH